MTTGPSSSARSTRLRAAVERLGDVRGRSEPEVRKALIAELSRDEITDASEPELRFLTDLALTSPRRAGWRLVGRQVGLIARTLKEVHDALALDAQPRWAEVPEHISAVPEGLPEADTDEVEGDLDADQLADGRATIGRVIADVHDQSEDADPEQVRPVGCWVRLNADETITMHIGTSEIARLTSTHTAAIRDAIHRWGAGTDTLRADADLYGATPDTAHLTYWIVVPADQATGAD